MAKLSGTLRNVAEQRGAEEGKSKGFKKTGRRANPADEMPVGKIQSPGSSYESRWGAAKKEATD